jgi:hypothetical protein
MFLCLVAQACSGANNANTGAEPMEEPMEEKHDAAPSTKKDGPTLPPPKMDGPATPQPLAQGASCTTSSQCGTGQCVDGVCCESACTETCKTCNAEGKCVAVAAGEADSACTAQPMTGCGRDGMCDGAGACRYWAADTECAPGNCTGTTLTPARVCDGKGTCKTATSTTCPTTCVNNSCNETCSMQNPCQAGFFCDPDGKCKAKAAAAAPCTTNEECSTNFCADGVCCRTACDTPCYSCASPSAPGTCTPAAAGQDPRKECLAEAPTTCGHAGGCDGAGACKLFPPNTPCGDMTCTGSLESGPRTCNGAGSCVAPDVIPCSPFRCGGTSCRSTCTMNSHCELGFICMSNSCMEDPNNEGLMLHWSFDETSGTTALDVSGGAHNGTYTGVTGTPTASTNVPQIGSENPRSRAFTRANRHAVQLANMPAELTPPNDFTVAAWYRATTVDTSGAELVSGGNNYLIRLRPTQVEFAKRYLTPANTTGTAQVFGTVPGMLSGAWHHVAGVASQDQGMKLYVDGKLVASDPTFVQDTIYDNSGRDFWVGRHGNGSANWDFQGNIDDVRFYNKALSDEELQRLVSGPPGVEILVHWRFDEASGNVAADDSDFGFNGAYANTQTSLDHAPVSFPDPRSRRFTRANRSNVRLNPMPAELQPPNNITLSAWYKATSVDTAGAEIISGRNSYVLRLLPTQIEFSKRYTNATNGGATHSLKTPDLAGVHLDGQWHHVAASTGSSGTKVYFDGVLKNSNAQRTEDLRYDQGADFWVGRNGNALATFDFEGNIDDVTVYGRELGEDEVAALAQKNGPDSPELALHWDFEEATGTVAQDQTANNFDGTYVGAPLSQSDVPGVAGDTRSRNFKRGTPRQAVELTPIPDALKPPNDLTVSLWYKAGTAPAPTEELLSAGDNYLLRLTATQIQFSKRITGGFADCIAVIAQAKHLDGNWHHIAGTTASGVQMRVYFDGVEQTGAGCPNNATTRADLEYNASTELWVGRHPVQATREFDGNIDEVRIYRRALTAPEIAELALQSTQAVVPALQWKFDETTGMTAADSSANGLDGTYIGDNAMLPVSDPLVPGIPQQPACLKFDGANRTAVTRAAMPAALKPTEITVAAWYHATALDTGGSELISGGNRYVLRLRPATGGGVTGVEFSKQTAGGIQRCNFVPANYLSGGWHHVAGVSSAAGGLALYFDGSKICEHLADNAPITYAADGDFFVGRHGGGELQWDFTGSIDDVRVYGSALTEAQIDAIIAGSF